MRARSLIAWVTTLSLFIASTPALAQQHIVTPAALQQAMDQQIAADRANRETVARVLSRSDVQRVADRMGLDVRQATHAVSQLSGAELAQVATAAQAAEADLAGGAQTVTISVTTLLIVLVLILLIAND